MAINPGQKLYATALSATIGAHVKAQAAKIGIDGVVGWGKAWQRRERQFDYKRKTGTATDALYGTSKVRFQDPGNDQNTNTAQEDFAVWVVDTAVDEA